MYRTRNKELDYIDKNTGIKYMQFVLFPSKEQVISLDSIFRLFETSSTIPLVKFNPRRDSDNILRLYSKQKNKQSHNIPFLNEHVVKRVGKELARQESVGCFILKSYDSTIREFPSEYAYVEMNRKCEMNVRIAFSEYKKLIFLFHRWQAD